MFIYKIQSHHFPAVVLVA